MFRSEVKREKTQNLHGLFFLAAVIAGCNVLLFIFLTSVFADTVTLRPDGAGDLSGLSVYPIMDSLPNYSFVDETTQDGDSTYCYTTSFAQVLDSYKMSNPGVTGTINSVTVFALMKTNMGNAVGSTLIKNDGVREYLGDSKSLTTSYVSYSTVYATNPYTDSAWTWQEVTDLYAGVALGGCIVKDQEARVTQVYLEVDYTPAVTGHQPFLGFE